MNPETVTPSQPELRPAPGRQTPLPEWVSTTDRNALPNNLDWASESPRPPITGLVDVIRFGISLGTGTAVGYFHRTGELGILVELDSVSPILDLPTGTSRAHFFGENITRLDQGDEPEETTDTADNDDVQDVFIFKADVAPEEAEQTPASDDEPLRLPDAEADPLPEVDKISL